MNDGWYIGESALLPMDPAWQLRGLLPQGFQRLDLQEDPPGKDGWEGRLGSLHGLGRRPAARLGDHQYQPDPPFSAEPC